MIHKTFHNLWHWYISRGHTDPTTPLINYSQATYNNHNNFYQFSFDFFSSSTFPHFPHFRFKTFRVRMNVSFFIFMSMLRTMKLKGTNRYTIILKENIAYWVLSMSLSPYSSPQYNNIHPSVVLSPCILLCIIKW